jgi:hypothetical protein
LSGSVLYPGETLLETKGANAIITISDFGLDPIFERSMRLVGLAGKEAIGGWLDLTSWRLIFRSHRYNRVTGSFSILLPTVLHVADASGLIRKIMRVTTHGATYDFVLWGVRGFISKIDAARAAADADEILNAIRGDPSLLGGGPAPS